MARTFQFDQAGKGDKSKSAPACPMAAACEELFADAIDGILSPADQTFFDRHLLGCAPCANAFSAAQRGAAWLSMLKSDQPEPPADLVDRIVAQTSGQQAMFDQANRLATVIPFAPRPAGRSRFAHFVRVMHEPRLAMTAAMAFFSIALTLNLAGVRLDQLHAANFNPTNLKRTYYEANASAVRYYDNLKVVRVLESRVDDIRQSNDDARTPESKPADTPQPETKPAPKPQETPKGSSRRESPLPASKMLRARFDAKLDKPRDDKPRFTQEGGLV